MQNVQMRFVIRKTNLAGTTPESVTVSSVSTSGPKDHNRANAVHKCLIRIS